MLRIKEVLKEKMLTEHDLANHFGVSRQYVNAIVKERSSCSLEMLSRIAEVLDVPIVSLFEGYQKPAGKEELVGTLKIPNTDIVLRITMIL